MMKVKAISSLLDVSLEYNGSESNVMQWKRNRISQDMDGKYLDDSTKIRLEKEDILIHEEPKRQKWKEQQRKSKLKRYSLPVGCINVDKNTRSLSLEGITRNHKKYRPWSVDVNEKFKEWLEQNAFESKVQLIGYCELSLTKKENLNSYPQEGAMDYCMENDTSKINEDDKINRKNNEEANLSKENVTSNATNVSESESKYKKYQGNINYLCSK